jgi:hypothetical protein
MHYIAPKRRVTCQKIVLLDSCERMPPIMVLEPKSLILSETCREVCSIYMSAKSVTRLYAEIALPSAISYLSLTSFSADALASQKYKSLAAGYMQYSRAGLW